MTPSVGPRISGAKAGPGRKATSQPTTSRDGRPWNEVPRLQSDALSLSETCQASPARSVPGTGGAIA
jgi:hypothetical protein